MPFDFSEYRVELRRHIGYMGTQFGMMPFEHNQKLVLVHVPNPSPGARSVVQCGYLQDVTDAPLLWLPEVVAEMPPQLVEHVEAEANRLKAAGEFVDPPEAEF